MVTIYVKNGTALEAQSKCESCKHAHIMRGYRESEEAVYCTAFYGRMLPVAFKVYECSSYTDRTRPTWEQMEDLAIDVLPLSSGSGKSAGFRSKVSAEAKRDEEDVPEPVNR